ncbi:nicotinate (nicotinamide) nucleotide adenylyltransferase [Kwoniella dejecticola CBS 10117]|uniref:Nicotinate (Nicotinamide) nucleotide adenylyltransferase n=1 Tax=Kwoniella dejecticola CBS 10117 TaxID=1296121 RepID=A0A1A5ZUD2_9TREE|nr:nicotinate (nicotinamide) nucleotide adenylyltransferase [Kwoniella dejecticola CBS 10117]OBR81411.1 nicotinate (nicotinamide) nucleotide adenylyltransferase [Kwoniella dejecticola CBS 10117]
MAANGFKSPAPVLPGLGLHSFHADSPPFAGAATSEHGDPEYLTLESSQTLPSSSPHDDSQLSPLRSQFQHNLDFNPIPSSSSSATIRPNLNMNAPIPQRVPIHRSRSSANSNPRSESTEEDVPLAPGSARSKRLLSGYLFGNPPTQTPQDGNGDNVARTRSPSEDSEEDGKYPLPSPPIQGAEAEDDSPPLTEAFKSYSSPNPNAQGLSRDPRSLSATSSMSLSAASGANARLQQNASPEDRPASSIEATASGSGLEANSVGVTNQTGINKINSNPEENDGTSSASNPRSRQISGTSTNADDALSGLNDGEADLDLSAPQAEDGGSGAYLRGEVEYSFPRHRLRKTMKDESKIPLVIVACGSFSPPTYLHLRMFEMAKDEIIESQTYEIMAGYYSPVSSYYKKSGLAPANHRVKMCELGVEHTSTWLMVDPWEAGQPEYQRTAIVLDHFDEMLNGGKNGEGGVIRSDGKKRRYKIMLLAGGDLIESFGEPGVWSEPDLHIILGRFGCLIVERAGSDVWAFLLSHDILYHHRRNVIVIKQLIYNDISSTKVRLFVRRGMSIKYLLPNSVIQYIYDNKLYRFTDVKATIG